MRILPICLAALLAASAGTALPAPKRAGAIPRGPIKIDFQNFSYEGSTLHFFGGVKMTSSQFDLSAADLRVLFAANKAQAAGPASIIKATADDQVIGHFDDVENGRRFEMKADHAVYVPDNSRPGGGRIDFTGHVHTMISAPAVLAEPSQGDYDHATVLLGPGPDYPALETGAGHLELTPLQ